MSGSRTEMIPIVYIMSDMNPCDSIEYANETSRRIAEQFGYASEAFIQPFIFAIGILTNLLSVIVLSGVRMNKVFRTCLLALALSDLAATTVGMIQILVEVLFYCGDVPEGYHRAPVIVNNTLYFTFLMFISSSASYVVLICFIRNVMYLTPLKARAYFSSKITMRLCGIIFMLTVILYLPTSLQVIWLACYKDITDEYCINVNKTIPIHVLEKVANSYLYFNVAVYGPVMLLLYLANFICIRVSLRRSAASITQMTQSSSNNPNKRNDTVSRITKTLSLILILDIICTLPSIIQSIGLVSKPETLFEKDHLFFLIIDPLAEIFLALKPTYNFWIYVFQRPEFRTRLHYLLQKSCQRLCRPQCCLCHDKFDDAQIQNKSIQLTTSSGQAANGSPKHPSRVTVTSLMKTTPPLSTSLMKTTPPLSYGRKISSSQ